MTTKRIIYTDSDGNVRRCTPAPQSMEALTGTGGMLPIDKIDKQAAAYVKRGMSAALAHKMAEGYARGGLTETEALNLTREAQGIPANAANLVVVEATDLPYFGTFGRFAWKQNGAVIPVFDMARARPIKTDQIRIERDARLVQEDIAYIRADEAGDTAEKARIAAKKQALRDLPVTIQPQLDALATPKALEAWQPTWPI